jgi:hypothetical protein
MEDAPRLSPGSYAAPPTRDGNFGYKPPRGKVRLTPQQIEAARFAGISIDEYARQVLAMQEARKNDPDRYGGQSYG